LTTLSKMSIKRAEHKKVLPVRTEPFCIKAECIERKRNKCY
jgi:hypothetical protein